MHRLAACQAWPFLVLPVETWKKNGLTKRWSEPPLRLSICASDSGWREFLLAVAQFLAVSPFELWINITIEIEFSWKSAVPIFFGVCIVSGLTIGVSIARSMDYRCVLTRIATAIL
jgi:hypothetical protein